MRYLRNLLRGGRAAALMRGRGIAATARGPQGGRGSSVARAPVDRAVAAGGGRGEVVGWLFKKSALVVGLHAECGS